MSRNSLETRRYLAVMEWRETVGTTYASNRKSSFRISAKDTLVVHLHKDDPKHAKIAEVEIDVPFDIRVLAHSDIKLVGTHPHSDLGRPHEALPVVYDGNGMFWWAEDGDFGGRRLPGRRDVANVVGNITDAVFNLVDKELELVDWNTSSEAREAALEIVFAESGKHGVFRGHWSETPIVGASSPAMALAVDEHFARLELVDQKKAFRSEEPRPVQTREPLYFSHRPTRAQERRREVRRDLLRREMIFTHATRFALFEFGAAAEVMALLENRTPEITVKTRAFEPSPDFDWTADVFSKDATASKAVDFEVFIGGLLKELALVHDVSEDDSGALMLSLMRGFTVPLHEPSVAVENLEKVSSVCDRLMEIRPDLDAVIAASLNWPIKVLPFELLKLRAEGMIKLLREATSASAI